MISRYDSRVRPIQRLLIDRFGLSVIGTADGDLGPRTYNGLTMVLGKGWWNLSGDGILASLGARTSTALPSYPFPERVRIAQSILHVTVDGKLGPQTWTALDARLPSWESRAWAEHMAGNIPQRLGAGASEAGVVASAPLIATTRERAGGTLSPGALADALKKLRQSSSTSSAAADAADKAVSDGTLSEDDRSSVLSVKPGLGTFAKVALGLGALGATWYLLKGRRRAA